MECTRLIKYSGTVANGPRRSHFFSLSSFLPPIHIHMKTYTQYSPFWSSNGCLWLDSFLNFLCLGASVKLERHCFCLERRMNLFRSIVALSFEGAQQRSQIDMYTSFACLFFSIYLIGSWKSTSIDNKQNNYIRYIRISLLTNYNVSRSKADKAALCLL